MVAGISGATPGSAAGGAEEPPNMPLKLVVSQPASTTDSIEMMARLATARAVPDLIMGIPRHIPTAAPVRSQAQNTNRGNDLGQSTPRPPRWFPKHHPILPSPRP